MIGSAAQTACGFVWPTTGDILWGVTVGAIVAIVLLGTWTAANVALVVRRKLNRRHVHKLIRAERDVRDEIWP